MIRCLIALSCLVSASAFGSKKFEDRKARMIEHLTQKIGHFEEAKTCAEGAADKAALKACRKALKDANKALKASRKADKMKRMEAKDKKDEEPMDKPEEE